jgi:Phosphomannose isomerase
MILRATKQEYNAICRLYESAANHMRASGLEQWVYGVYPNDDLLYDDIEKGQMYLFKENGEIMAAMVMNRECDKEYIDIAWLFGINPIYMHRLAVAPCAQGKGIGTQMLAWLAKEAVSLGHDCLRLDAYSLNEKALRLYTRFNMRAAGPFFFEWKKEPFICFEKPLTENCPLLPIPMLPAFRHGEMTPWGGEKLRQVFHKPIPDDRTGESLEVSVLPSLNSTDSTDTPLAALIAKYGEKLLGEDWEAPFPLLLKFIDAKEALSVQVHPDDAYAFAHENGKLGKEEAWVVLQADEGATLIYGTEKGVTTEDLRLALKDGKAVEKLMRKVPVKQMDVLFIPAGCIHAIGGGIMLYEIQQSSDVTYRLYDYDRADKEGNRRELHIEKSLAVCDTAIQLNPIPAPENPGLERVLDKRRFILDSALVQGELRLERLPSYALLTVMDDMDLSFADVRISAPKGQTYFLPATCPEVTLIGHGRALIAMPPKNKSDGE